ncbi:MAG: helix-turn-helix domain-containing protein [Alcaligenaceae bacterium]|nr:helix-turn-helix domain-containing protein [Alcaligenaceae bacterium]
MKPLTERELTCLQWVSIGKTSWETGRILGLAERTINFHIQNACRKLGVHSRQAAITTAMRTGLLSFDEDAPDTASPLLPRVTMQPEVRHNAN